MPTPPRAVLLAVGADGCDASMAFAVDEARRTRRALHLVHVLQLPTTDAYAGVYDVAEREAHALLRRAVDAADRRAGDDVPVSAELVDHGAVVRDLCELSEDASLLVLQHRAMSRVTRTFVGSVAQRAAGRAPVPVVSVPEGWHPRAVPSPVVTAAVQDPVEAPALLRAAFTQARARSADLAVLHAWWLASGYDTVVVDGAYRRQWAERTREEIEPVLAPLRSEFPDVAVALSVLHCPPIEAVLDAAEVSQLLVLGRRHHLLPLGSHLGPVARAALDHATCPVLVTPELAVAADPHSDERETPARTGVTEDA